MPLKASRGDKLFDTVFLLLSVGEKRGRWFPTNLLLHSDVTPDLAQHCGGDLHKQIASWTRPAIIGILIGSAAMNALAFAAQTKNLWMTSARNPGHRHSRRWCMR
jgi:hypothetical protein